MPITQSAIKAQRVSERKRVFNLRRSRAMKAAVKEVTGAVHEKRADAATLLASAYKAIDKAAKRGVVKANTAARKKSRLARLVAGK